MTAVWPARLNRSLIVSMLSDSVACEWFDANKSATVQQIDDGTGRDSLHVMLVKKVNGSTFLMVVICRIGGECSPFKY